MKDFLKGILLFIIALVPTFVITIISILVSFIYYLLSFNWQLGLSKLGEYFWSMALSIDQFANVSIQIPLTYLLIKKYDRQKKLHYKFGDEDETVSLVIAENDKRKTLNKFGKFWAWFLNTVDKDHLKKAIENRNTKYLDVFNKVKNNMK